MSSKKFRSLEEVKAIIGRMRVSGLSRWGFAKREGICYTTLANYEKRLAGSVSGAVPKHTGVADFSQGRGVSRRQKKKKRGLAFVEALPVAESGGAGIFTLRRGGFQLEFSLVDLGFVLSELETRA